LEDAINEILKKFFISLRKTICDMENDKEIFTTEKATEELNNVFHSNLNTAYKNGCVLI